MITLPPSLALTGSIAGLVFVAACSTGPSSGPLASTGQFFQYASVDGKVVAEYDAHDAATCATHLSNLRGANSHGADTLRCSASSASTLLPTSAAAADGRGSEFSFRFASRDDCQRMLPAIAKGGRITRQCS